MGERIILITEDEGLKESLSRQLQEWGHHPLAATDPADARNLVADRRPPLAILDAPPRGDGGLAALAGLKTASPWTEIIFLVPAHELELGAAGLELSASDFLVKPLSANRLGVALQRARERLAARRKLAVLAGGEEDREAASASRLSDTQARYQQLFDEVPCYISVLDPDHRIVAVNRSFKEEFGDRIGEYCFKVNKNISEPCPGCQVDRTFGDGRSHQFEEVLTSLSGEQYHVLTHTAPLRDAEGRIVKVMEMSTNITPIRKLQNHLADLGLFIGSISHGVKGLLTALDGGMYNVRMGLAKGDQHRLARGWEVVEVMVGRIRRTVLDILFYAKDRDISKDLVDVGWFARQVMLVGQAAANKNDIIFESNIKEDLGFFAVDPNALQPALVNILENAVDACLEDRKKAFHKVQFHASREDDVIVFDVVDNGQGMDEETKEKMFTLFFTSKGSSGTGLGLFIASDTVAQHGGSIIVDSEPGLGSHFHVRIPAGRQPRKARSG